MSGFSCSQRGAAMELWLLPVPLIQWPDHQPGDLRQGCWWLEPSSVWDGLLARGKSVESAFSNPVAIQLPSRAKAGT